MSGETVALIVSSAVVALLVPVVIGGCRQERLATRRVYEPDYLTRYERRLRRRARERALDRGSVTLRAAAPTEGDGNR